MKAQSAIEYLTTYGWMLLVVSIVSGVVYSQFGAHCPDSASGFTGQSISINDFGLTANSDDLDFALENSRTDQITIDRIRLSNEDENVDYTINEDLGPGSEKGITLPGVTPTEECNTVNIQIEYSIGSQDQLENQFASGAFTSNIQIGQGTAPVAPENLEAIFTG